MGLNGAVYGTSDSNHLATGVRPHTKRSKTGDRGPVHVGTWYASRHCDEGYYYDCSRDIFIVVLTTATMTVTEH